jgi:hypothetical protein
MVRLVLRRMVMKYFALSSFTPKRTFTDLIIFLSYRAVSPKKTPSHLLFLLSVKESNQNSTSASKNLKSILSPKVQVLKVQPVSLNKKYFIFIETL